MIETISKESISKFNEIHTQLGNIENERHRHEIASLICEKEFDLGLEL